MPRKQNSESSREHQAQASEERKQDLKRILELEALLLLLLRRRSAKALRLDEAKRAAALMLAVQTAILQVRAKAAESALETTAAQLRAATGKDWRLRLSRSFQQTSKAAAQSEAHAAVSRWFESQTPGGRPFDPDWSRRASWEVVQSYNEARREALDNLPERVKEQLWLRWDTAGDRRVCGACGDLKGKIVPASKGFPRPAPLHGSCRCTETIIRADEV